MAVLKLSTPGAYVQEIPSLPPSVAEVKTAIPAFIGYTEKADRFSKGDLIMIPIKIENMSEYETFYGKAAIESPKSVNIEITNYGNNDYDILVNYKIPKPEDPPPPQQPVPDNPLFHLDDKSNYNLYYSIKHFYDNGGGTCYITAVDTYQDSGKVEADKLIGGITAVADIDEVTILSVPESIKMDSQADLDKPTPVQPAKYIQVVGQLIEQTNTLQDRFALIDPFIVTSKTSKLPSGKISRDVEVIRNATPTPSESKYAAAYYPNLITTYTYRFNVDSTDPKDPDINLDKLIVNKYSWAGTGDDPKTPIEIKQGTSLKDLKIKVNVLYTQIKTEVNKRYVVLPPSPAIAGLYTRVDNTKGVWKAPANESLFSVVSPDIAFSNREQDNLNIDPNSGKSINVIRTFPGYGTLVWGARTLNGNDNEWKYISVRRFFNMVEESIKKSSQWAVFEPNTINTWVKISAMIENYLFVKWRDGALAGSKPEQAFYVRVGLGTTMTALDILEGRMNIEIGMAVARPAEFIVLKFTQLMQQS
jgi:phage tail sheath protein FI